MKTQFDKLNAALEAKGFSLSLDRIRDSRKWHATAWRRSASGWSKWRGWPRPGEGNGYGDTPEKAIAHLLKLLGDEVND